MTEKITVYEAVANVMRDVQAVKKKDRNEHQRFNFRGIDAVMSAVGPVLRAHGVVVVPIKMGKEKRDTTTSTGKPAVDVDVKNTYRWFGPAGDYFDTEVTGEAMDNGDKGTAKANSVAFRTLLLQALCLPTDEPDPDSFSPERAVEIRDAARTRAHDDISRRLGEATTVEALRGLWQEANKAGFDDLKQKIEQRTETVKADGAT